MRKLLCSGSAGKSPFFKSLIYSLEDLKEPLRIDNSLSKLSEYFSIWSGRVGFYWFSNIKLNFDVTFIARGESINH